jgi:hypothetical protein
MTDEPRKPRAITTHGDDGARQLVAWLVEQIPEDVGPPNPAVVAALRAGGVVMHLPDHIFDERGEPIVTIFDDIVLPPLNVTTEIPERNPHGDAA